MTAAASEIVQHMLYSSEIADVSERVWTGNCSMILLVYPNILKPSDHGSCDDEDERREADGEAAAKRPAAPQ